MRTKSRIYIKVNFVCFLLLFSVASKAEYTDSCGLYAQMLWSAADGYESAKSSYESACDPYFEYSKGNESACGSYGYERTSYDSAKSELESALSNVSIFCGTGDQLINPMLRAFKKQVKNLDSEISLLKDKIKKLEAENKALNNIIKLTQ